MKTNQRSKTIFIISTIAIIIFVFLLGFTKLPWIISKPLMVQENIKKAPVIVVLYCGYGDIKKNGLGKFSLNRVNKAVQLWKKDLASYLLFSGGGADKRAFNLTGSERMALEAIRLDIPEEKIIIEHDSKDSRHNVLKTSSILKKKLGQSYPRY